MYILKEKNIGTHKKFNVKKISITVQLEKNITDLETLFDSILNDHIKTEILDPSDKIGLSIKTDLMEYSLHIEYRTAAKINGDLVNSRLSLISQSKQVVNISELLYLTAHIFRTNL